MHFENLFPYKGTTTKTNYAARLQYVVDVLNRARLCKLGNGRHLNNLLQLEKIKL